MRGHETEIKLPVRGRRALKWRLKELRFRVVRARHFETNALFDYDDRRLLKARCLLRLRGVGREWVLTYKGTPVRSKRFKIRPEFETGVSDGPRVRTILENLGLDEVFRYEKFRTVYSQDARHASGHGGLLVYDELPIGEFIELEGPREWIDEVAQRLGYGRKDYITASYGSLYRQKCRAEGVKPTNMVFKT